MSDARELERRRTEAWLELDESEMIQTEIGELLRVSQPTVNRAIKIAKGERDEPYTDYMNSAIDRYIVLRDERRAERERKQRDDARRAAAEEALREEEDRREQLWDWVDGEMLSEEQSQILRAYHQWHNPREPLTSDEELAILAHHLEGKDGYLDPPVEITLNLPPSRVVCPPADLSPVTHPQEPPRETVVTPRQADSPPIRRNASPPRRRVSSPVRPKRKASRSPSTVDYGKVLLVASILLLAVAVVGGTVVLVSTDTARDLWATVSETSPYWVVNDNYSGRSCCLTGKCYRNFLDL